MIASDLDLLTVSKKIDALNALYVDLHSSLRKSGRDTRQGKAKIARNRLRSRRARDHFFPSKIFADPAWDMLLDLYAAHHEGQRVSVSSLCIAASVPATTALRHINIMVDSGYFVKEVDEADGRRVYVSLTIKAQDALESYFQEIETIP